MTTKLPQIILFAGAVLSLTTGYGLATPMVSIEPPSQTVEAGQSLSVSVNVFDVADLYAFEFELVSDPAILAAMSVIEGPFLPSGGSTVFIPGTIDNNAGSISAIADTLIGPIPGVTGTGSLVTAAFEAVGLGTSTISLSNVILLDSNLALIEASTVDGTVNVQPAEVPEPASWALLSTPLLGALALSHCAHRRSIRCTSRDRLSRSSVSDNCWA